MNGLARKTERLVAAVGYKDTTAARVTSPEREALNAIKEREVLNESEGIRFCIRIAAQELGLWPPQEANRGD